MQKAYYREDGFVKKKKFEFNIGLSNVYCNLWKQFDKVFVYFNFRCFFSFFFFFIALYFKLTCSKYPFGFRVPQNTYFNWMWLGK